MTREELRKVYEEMPEAVLLPTLAFFESDYPAENWTLLKRVAQARGFSESRIRTYREVCYADSGLSFNCKNCNCELLLDKETFVDGAYTCPDCRITNRLEYLELELPDNDELLRQLLHVGAHLVGVPLLAMFIGRDKRPQKRAGIMNGTYWRALKLFSDASKKSDPSTSSG